MGAEGGVIKIVLKEKADYNKIYSFLDTLHMIHHGYHDSIASAIRDDNSGRQTIYSAYGTDIEDIPDVNLFIDNIKSSDPRSLLTFNDLMLEIDTCQYSSNGFKMYSDDCYELFDYLNNTYNDLEITIICVIGFIKHYSYNWIEDRAKILDVLNMDITNFAKQLSKGVDYVLCEETWT